MAGNTIYFLNVYGYYDLHTFSTQVLNLNIAFISRRCLSTNYQTGVWSIADAVTNSA
jgi:hypothetical protein